MLKPTLLRRFTAGLLVTAVFAFPAGAEQPGAVEQPTQVPGKWEPGELELPPAKDIIARPAPDRPVYGLYTWGNEYRQLHDEIKKVGWTNIRLSGPIDDATMKLLAADEMEVMYTASGVLDAEGKRRKRDAFDTDEAFIKAYQDQLRNVLDRYGPGGKFFAEHEDLPNRPVRHLEIWNEPNFHYMIPDREGVDRKAIEAERYALYAKLLPAAYDTIKQHAPTVQVVGFGAGGSSSGDLRFIQAVHDSDATIAGKYDILSTHPYMHDAPPDGFAVKTWGKYTIANNLATIRKTLAEADAGDKPIWYTEIGWPIDQADGGHFPGKAHGTVTPLLQAAYTVRLYALAVRMGVGRVHNMFITDSDGFNGGFFNRQNQWRPSAYATATMIDLMPNPKLTGVISDGQEGVFIYRFAPNGGINKPGPGVIMAWRVHGGTHTATIPWTETQATVIDMFGHETKAQPEEGKLTVQLGPAPVYIVPR